MIADAGERGVDEAYRDWVELREIQHSTNSEEAVERLTALLGRHRSYLRDRTLELLLTIYSRTGNRAGERAVAQELADHRTPLSPPSKRPYDLVNLGVTSSKQGDMATARAAFSQAHPMMAGLTDDALRGLLRLRAGIFSRNYDNDRPTAVHSFRAAIEDFRSAHDAISMAYVFEQLSATFRDIERPAAMMYASLAEQLVINMDGDERGVAGDYGRVAFDVARGMAEAEFLLDDIASAAARVNWLLTDSEVSMNDDERLALERIALACAIRGRKWRAARRMLASWSAEGRDDWTALGRAALAISRSAVYRRNRKVEPVRERKLAGLGETLRRLGFDPADAAQFLAPMTRSALSEGLIDALAGAARADPIMARRLFGDYESAAWATRTKRAAKPASIRPNGGPLLPPGAPWPEVIIRYHELGVWELPDLAVLGPVLDHWATLSRFGDAVRINQPALGDGSLDVYFFRSDPEGYLEHIARGCVFVPEGELIICSLPYLDDLFGIEDIDWEAEREEIKDGLRGYEADVDEVAAILVSKVKARARVLLEWVIAHEIGHAHHGHAAAARTAEQAFLLEDAADSFFLDGVVADDGAGELFLALSTQLRHLYAYDAERQLQRRVTAEEKEHLSVVLDGRPDKSGHRPLVFRAVSLVRSLLRRIPELGDIDYYDRFSASLENR
jgi:hypothetical protein